MFTSLENRTRRKWLMGLAEVYWVILWPLTWSDHHYGMCLTSLGHGHQRILFFSGNWLFMEFLILWAPLHCSPPQPSFLSGSIFLSFLSVPQALGSSISTALKHFSQQPWLLPSFIHSENSFNFCYHLFPKSEVAEATYFCLTHFTRFIWYIWPNQIPDYSSFPLN